MANPKPDTTAIAGHGALIRDDNAYPAGWNYASITGTATTLVKTGAGILHSITFNKPVATGTVKIDDALTDTTPVIGTITIPASPMPVTLFYDLAFSVGLTIVTGTAAQDITVSYI